MAYEYKTVHCIKKDGILTAIIDNPPVNVMTIPLYQDLVALTTEVARDDEVQVLVFDSADPDFFIAHFDVEVLIASPIDRPPMKSAELNDFHRMCQRVRTMPKATIVKMCGRAGGGGNEFASSCDMRFGIRGKTIVNQMEVALGILPGGTGTQTLPRLVGRGRAMEIILGSDDIDADTLADWGHLNRVFDNRDALDEFVDALAFRISRWPQEALALAKASVNAADTQWQEGILEEAFLFQRTLRTEGAQQNMRRAVAKGAQTREGELRMGQLCLEFATD